MSMELLGLESIQRMRQALFTGAHCLAVEDLPVVFTSNIMILTCHHLLRNIRVT